MAETRKHYDNDFKVRVVLESLQKNIPQEKILIKYGINSSILHRWRKQFMNNVHTVFDKPAKKQKDKQSNSPEYLKKIIGDITVENEILKKALSVWD